MNKSLLGLFLVSVLWVGLLVAVDSIQRKDDVDPSPELWNETLVTRSNQRISVTDEAYIYQDRVLKRSQNPLEAVEEVSQKIQALSTLLGEDITLHGLIVPSASAVDPMTQTENTAELDAIRQIATSVQNTTFWDIASILEEYKDKRLFFFTDEWWTSIAAYHVSFPVIEALGFVPQTLETFNVQHELNVKGTHRLLHADLTSDPFYVYLWNHFNPEIEVSIIQPGKEDKTYQTLLYAKSRKGFDSLVEGYYRYATIKGKGEGSILLIGDTNAKFMVQWLVPYYETIYLSNMSFDDRSAVDLRALIDDNQIEDVLLIGSFEHLSLKTFTQSLDRWLEQEQE